MDKSDSEIKDSITLKLELYEVPQDQVLKESLKDRKEISVLSFNILADAFLKNPKKEDPKSSLSIVNRLGCILRSLLVAQADICILQEVDNLEILKKPFSKIGYELCFKKRTDGPDAVVILYKKDRFNLLKSEGIDFNKGHLLEDLKYTQNNVGICVELMDKVSNKKVVVLGCHLFWDPSLEQVKYLQTLMMLDYLEARYTENDVIFWGGDFNSKPGDNAIEHVYSRQPPSQENIPGDNRTIYKDQKKIFDLYNNIRENYIEFKNLYSMYGRSIGNNRITFPPYTNYKSSFKATLDHIFYAQNTALPTAILKIDQEGVEKHKDLPALGFPSDHLPIMGVFLI